MRTAPVVAPDEDAAIISVFDAVYLMSHSKADDGASLRTRDCTMMAAAT